MGGVIVMLGLFVLIGWIFWCMKDDCDEYDKNDDLF